MRLRCFPMLAVACSLALAAQQVKNSKVTASERTLAAGEAGSKNGEFPFVAVFLDAGTVEIDAASGKPAGVSVAKGSVRFFPVGPSGSIRNAGSSPLRYVRIDFTGPGGSETWGTRGLAPNYRLLLENQFTRVYDIRIPAHTNEPRHSHNDRVVVCLSGATLRHRFPDGREEPSTLKTGEVAWRRESTHIGQNLGGTDLWVIAVEPK